MALAEDEVHDLEDVGRPGLEEFGPRHGQGQAGIADLVLRPDRRTDGRAHENLRRTRSARVPRRNERAERAARGW